MLRHMTYQEMCEFHLEVMDAEEKRLAMLYFRWDEVVPLLRGMYARQLDEMCIRDSSSTKRSWSVRNISRNANRHFSLRTEIALPSIR